MSENKDTKANTKETETTHPHHHTEHEVLKPHDHSNDINETNARYLAYGARIRTFLTATHRYLAYTSDVGEAFRPVVTQFLVRSAYGISWAYVLADVGYEGYKDYRDDKDSTEIARTVIKRGLFQSVASMALPAVAIHTQVGVFTKLCNRVGRFQRWGPTIAGLSLLPLLPYMFDHPAEHLIDKGFANFWPSKYGDERHHHHHNKEKEQ